MYQMFRRDSKTPNLTIRVCSDYQTCNLVSNDRVVNHLINFAAYTLQRTDMTPCCNTLFFCTGLHMYLHSNPIM